MTESKKFNLFLVVVIDQMQQAAKWQHLHVCHLALVFFLKCEQSESPIGWDVRVSF
jgi:hypothetical protein